jgi:hypothetical protein
VLPSTLQFLIAMIASAINERMQRKLDYTQEEVRVLKEILRLETGSGRISFTADQRRGLALAGKELSPDERRKYCQLVKPATILAWFRELGARKYDSSAARKRGRPRKARNIRLLVIEMGSDRDKAPDLDRVRSDRSTRRSPKVFGLSPTEPAASLMIGAARFWMIGSTGAVAARTNREARVEVSRSTRVVYGS